jgi:hypothetical protein
MAIFKPSQRPESFFHEAPVAIEDSSRLKNIRAKPATGTITKWAEVAHKA